MVELNGAPEAAPMAAESRAPWRGVSPCRQLSLGEMQRTLAVPRNELLLPDFLVKHKVSLLMSRVYHRPTDRWSMHPFPPHW